MKQYCRYCAKAVLQGDDFIYCESKSEMRGKPECVRVNHCKQFALNPYDVFGQDENGNFKEYHPRGPYKPRREQIKDSGQLELEGVDKP